MTGQPVPADDLPSAGGVAVPPSDLPVTGTPPKEEGLLTTQFAAPVDAAMSFATGLVAQPVAGLLGLGQGLRNVLSPVTGNPEGIPAADVVRKAQDAFTYQPRTQRGQTIMDVVGIPGEVVSDIAGKVGERGEQVSPALGAIGHTSVEAIPALVGFRGALKPKPKLTPKQEAAGKAMDAGFTMTPEEMGAGPVARTAASVSGEPRLARAASNKNQPVIVEKLAADLNIPSGTVVDLDAIKTVLKREHQAYENLRGAGVVEATQQFYADLDALAGKYSRISKDFPDLAPRDLQAVIEGARRNVFDANSAVDLINQLRQSATDAFASRQSGLGKVYRGVADAVEAELGRHVQAYGQPELLKQFTHARERIAKAHMLEDALLAPDAVNPKVYAEAARDGQRLTGGTKEVAEYAARNERSAQKPSAMATGATSHDILAGLIAGLRSSGGSLLLDALTAGARPALRAALNSRAGQSLMDPRTNISGPAQQALGFGSLPRPQEENQ